MSSTMLCMFQMYQYEQAMGSYALVFIQTAYKQFHSKVAFQTKTPRQYITVRPRAAIETAN